MILTRSPLRISLGGGGTDLPSYYQKFGGFLIAGAIDKYVYVSINKPFEPTITLKYSSLENVKNVLEIKHNIIRETLLSKGYRHPSLEITTLAELPSGTGLGSSGSFTTALIFALEADQRNALDKHKLAEEACHIEIDRLREPIGKQDQYIAAFGGLKCFTFNMDDTVSIQPLKISNETLFNLEDNLLLFFTGFSRSASEILSEQNKKSLDLNNDIFENLHVIKNIGYKSKEALEEGDLEKFAYLMDEHWQYKKERDKVISSSKINDWYDIALKNGALGGKLVGAGGGGFLMFYAHNKVMLRRAMKKIGLEEVRFRFDHEGTKVVFS